MIGILAFGSLRKDPGPELEAAMIGRRPVATPFPVEYGRYSQTRRNAPTLVPVSSGSSVKAEILVLRDDVSIENARDMLWRRETRRERTRERYKYPMHPGPNDVLVRDLSNFADLATVLYTDFAPEGKIPNPDPRQLAEKAVQSVKRAKRTHDGISYLIDARAAGVLTRLTPAYEAEILRLTGASTLTEARERAETKG